MAAERLHDAVVARRQQRAAHGARGAIVLHLKLMLGVPAGVIADDRDDGDTVADRRVELERVETERAVAERGDDRELRPRELGGAPSTTMNRQRSAKAGGPPKRSVKSSRLPSSNTRSASLRQRVAPRRLGSLTPRGLSINRAGIPVSSLSRSTSFQRAERPMAAPAMISGLLAWPSRSSVRRMSTSSIGRGSADGAGACDAVVTPASSRSPGKLRCTGPGGHADASESARVISSPMRSALSTIHAALLTGRAAPT